MTNVLARPFKEMKQCTRVMQFPNEASAEMLLATEVMSKSSEG
jgi:hypothetical protein